MIFVDLPAINTACFPTPTRHAGHKMPEAVVRNLQRHAQLIVSAILQQHPQQHFCHVHTGHTDMVQELVPLQPTHHRIVPVKQPSQLAKPVEHPG